MYKNGTGINIDKISEIKGDFKQGVEIFVNNLRLDIDTIKEAIGSLIFFENLTIYGKNIPSTRLNTYITAFNKRKIENFKNFSTSDYDFIDSKIYAKIGRVIYNIDESTLKSRFVNNNSFIAIDCPIGSVNVTPNREQLQYTDKTIKKIDEAVENVKKELNDLALLKINQNFKSINDAYNFYVHSDYLELSSRIHVNAMRIMLFEDLTINGVKPSPEVWKILQKCRYEYIDDYCIYEIINKDRRLSKKDVSFDKMFQYNIALKCDDKMKKITKQYYSSQHSETTIILKESEIRNILHKAIRKCVTYNTASKVEALKAISFILKNLKYYRLENDKVPKDFIESNKKTQVKSENKRVSIRRYKNMAYNVLYLNEYIKYYVYAKNGRKSRMIHNVVYTVNLKDDKLLRDLDYTFSDMKIDFITLKKEDLHNIPNNKTFISLENFLNLYQKIISKIATAKYLEREFVPFYSIMGSGRRLVKDHKQKFYDYINKYHIFTNNEDIKKLLQQYEEKKWFDWAAIIEFNLTEEDKKRLTQRSIISDLTDVTDSLLYVIKGKYKNDDKFGIKPDNKTTLLLKKLLKL